MLDDAPALAGLPAEHEVLARAGSENFPVALRVLPRRYREHLTAVYGYARLVDDVGDELPGGPAERRAALDAVEAELDNAFAGSATHPVFVRLAATIASCRLERDDLTALVEANRIDQDVTSYSTFEELLGYCRLSADPVGRMVLGVFGCAGAERERLSDLVCTALQLVEHFQDVVEDADRGRIYLPAEDLERFGVAPGELRSGASGTKGSASAESREASRRLMAFEVGRARTMLEEGSRLVGLVPGWARVAIAGFVAGGLAQFDAIEAASFDVLSAPVKASKSAIAGHAVRLLARNGRQRP
jgi:squalene synthase HpnC